MYAEGLSEHRLNPSTISRIPNRIKEMLEDDSHPLTYIPDAFHLRGCGIRQSYVKEKKERIRQEMIELDERTIASSSVLYPRRDIPRDIPMGGTGGGNQPESAPALSGVYDPTDTPGQTASDLSSVLDLVDSLPESAPALSNVHDLTVDLPPSPDTDAFPYPRFITNPERREFRKRGWKRTRRGDGRTKRIAYLGLRFVVYDDRWITYIDDIYVEAAFRDFGIARQGRTFADLYAVSERVSYLAEHGALHPWHSPFCYECREAKRTVETTRVVARARTGVKSAARA